KRSQHSAFPKLGLKKKKKKKEPTSPGSLRKEARRAAAFPPFFWGGAQQSRRRVERELLCPCGIGKEAPETLNPNPSTTCPLKRRSVEAFPEGRWGAAGRGLPGCASVSPRGVTAGVRVRLCGKRPERSRPGGGADSVALAGAQPPPGARHGLGAGRDAGGASRRRGGSAAGRPGAPGGRWRKRGRRCSQPLGGLSGSSWRLVALLPPVSCSRQPGGRALLEVVAVPAPFLPPEPGRVPSLDPGAPRGAAGRGRGPVRRRRRRTDGGAPCGRRLPTPGPWLR
ncbi:hypothetical protein MC885_004394, partial [Smutsia gigantea]